MKVIDLNKFFGDFSESDRQEIIKRSGMSEQIIENICRYNDSECKNCELKCEKLLNSIRVKTI